MLMRLVIGDEVETAGVKKTSDLGKYSGKCTNSYKVEGEVSKHGTLRKKLPTTTIDYTYIEAKW